MVFLDLLVQVRIETCQVCLELGYLRLARRMCRLHLHTLIGLTIPVSLSPSPSLSRAFDLSLSSFFLSVPVPAPPFHPAPQGVMEYLSKFCLKLLLARNGFHLPPTERKEFRTQLGFLVRYVGCTRVRKSAARLVWRLRSSCMRDVIKENCSHSDHTWHFSAISAVLAHVHACMHNRYMHACMHNTYIHIYVYIYMHTYRRPIWPIRIWNGVS